MSINRTILARTLSSIYEKSRVLCGVAIGSALLSTSVFAAEEATEEAQATETISVIGSRVAGRTEADIPVPVDLISS